MKISSEQLFQKLVCPYSKRIFHKPVLANDDTVYEEESIFKILEKHNGISPITNKEISIDYKNIKQLDSIIQMFINKYPKYLFDVYKPHGIICNMKLDEELFDNIIKRKNYDKLLLFEEFDIKYFGNPDNFIDMVKNTNDHLTREILSNIKNINRNDLWNWQALNYIVAHCSSNKVKIALDAGCDIHSICSDDKYTAFHQIFGYNHSIELRKYFIDNSLDLLSKNKFGRTPLEKIDDIILVEYALRNITSLEKNIALYLIDKFESLRDLVNSLKWT